MKTTIGLEVARNIGDYLVAPGKSVSGTGDCEPGIRSGADDIGIVTSVYRADPRSHRNRVQTSLPLGRGVPAVTRLEREQVGGIARPQTRRILKNRHKFRIKADVDSAVVIVELEICKQRHVREDILDEDS